MTRVELAAVWGPTGASSTGFTTALRYVSSALLLGFILTGCDNHPVPPDQGKAGTGTSVPESEQSNARDADTPVRDKAQPQEQSSIKPKLSPKEKSWLKANYRKPFTASIPTKADLNPTFEHMHKGREKFEKIYPERAAKLRYHVEANLGDLGKHEIAVLKFNETISRPALEKAIMSVIKKVDGNSPQGKDGRAGSPLPAAKAQPQDQSSSFGTVISGKLPSEIKAEREAKLSAALKKRLNIIPIEE